LFETRIRALRQEQERLKHVYERRAGLLAPDMRKISELEEILAKTKNYYHQRIREIEDKFKFRINVKPPTEEDLKR